MPKITVILPVFNGAKYLLDAIISVKDQAFKDWELIIIDNCSADSSFAIANLYASHDSRIRAIRNEKNLLLCPSLNRGMYLAKGDLIKFLCHDDVLDKDCLNKMMREIYSSNVSMVSCNRTYFDAMNRQWPAYSFASPGLKRGRDVINECLLKGNLIGNISAVMMRNRSRDNPVFLARHGVVSDLGGWFDILQSGDLYHIEEPLVSIRQHPDQDGHQHVKNHSFVKGERILFNEYIRRPWVSHPWLKRIMFEARLLYIKARS